MPIEMTLFGMYVYMEDSLKPTMREKRGKVSKEELLLPQFFHPNGTIS